MSILSAVLIAITAYLTYIFITIVIPPPSFPRNIPTIPFYVSFLPLLYDLDQAQIYEKYLRVPFEQYGAVKIYFASRWNILVTKPEYLEEIFKDEDVYAKSGNQKKIPYSVLSTYTGDNVISAHGGDWWLYRKILTKSIQFPNLAPVVQNGQKMMKRIGDYIEKNGATMMVADVVQKCSLANVGDCIFGIDFHVFEDGEIHNRIKYIKKQIFKAFFLSFPFFDRLGIPSRVQARKEVETFRTQFSTMVKKELENSSLESAGYKLSHALKTGHLTEQQFTDNAIITMVAGHENPQLLYLSVLYVLAKHPSYQKALRDAMRQIPEQERIERSLQLAILNSILYETLRMYPPLGQIINRITTKETMLGNVSIPKGVYVGYNNYGTGRDRLVWGDDSDSFRPERWGSTLDEINSSYLAAKRTARLPAFHGRKRACIGEKYALYQTKVQIVQMVDQFEFELAKGWNDKITPAGPICPWMLELEFKRS